MAQYKVLLERPVYESAFVYVEANSETDAIDEALSVPTWELDWELSTEAVGDAQVMYIEKTED